MQFYKINGNTYYIQAPTNLGLFQFKDRYTLLIDSGDNNQQARKIAETIKVHNFNIKYMLSTHHHPDHTGGISFLQQNYPGSLLYAGGDEQLYLENSHLFPTYLYGGSPMRELARHFLKGQPLRVDEIVQPGPCRINDEKFEILPLPGHSPGQIGLGTRDRVCFLGDSLFSREIIGKYSFPFLFAIQDQLNTYDFIDQLDYDWFVLGHAEQVYTQAEIVDLVQINRDNLNYYLDMVRDLLIQPHTREELLEEICILQELVLDFKEYFFSLATAGAIIAYLYDRDELTHQLENGRLYFYKK